MAFKERCGCIYCEFLYRMDKALQSGEQVRFYCFDGSEKLSDPFEQSAYMDERATVEITKQYVWQ